MKHLGIASPRLACNVSTPILLFILTLSGALSLAIHHNRWVTFFAPILFLTLFIISVVKYYKAFMPFWMNETGIHNPHIHILWQNVTNVELIVTVVPTRSSKIQRLSIGIGETEYGDIFAQSPTKCIVLPLSKRTISQLQHWGGGKSSALDQFLATQTVE